MKHKIIYICHPIGGDVPGNIEKIKRIVRLYNRETKDEIPFVPYLSDVISLSDHFEGDRLRGLSNALEVLSRGIVDEMHVFGEPTTGMQLEIDRAEGLGIKIVMKKQPI